MVRFVILYETIEKTKPSNVQTSYVIRLDPSKASGSDGIPGRVLKECSSVIAPSFAYFSTVLLILELYPQNGNPLTLLQSIKMET